MQLNPGGTLNHKYAGETAVRSSGLPYSVIRSTGLPAFSLLLHSALATLDDMTRRTAFVGHDAWSVYEVFLLGGMCIVYCAPLNLLQLRPTVNAQLQLRFDQQLQLAAAMRGRCVILCAALVLHIIAVFLRQLHLTYGTSVTHHLRAL